MRRLHHPRMTGLLLSALLALPAVAAAIDQNQQFRTVGVGAIPCSRFTEIRASDNENAWAPFGIWAAGFLSSHNLLHRDTYDFLGDTTPDQVMSALDRFCGEMPDQPFVFALMRYIGEDLKAQRLHSRPTPPAGETPEAPAAAEPETR